MTRYWWVNHKQTFQHEINGRYVWAPKTKRDGRSNHFYDNLRRASPGDIVISFANSLVSYVGRVSDYALSSPKPDSFGNAGDAWSNDGWMLPVTWYKLEAPFRPSLFVESLPALLREKYAPIRAATGWGNQGAYLSEIDQHLVEFILQKMSSSLEFGFLLRAQEFEVADAVEEVDANLEQQVLISTALSDTDKIQIIKARRGQGIFRLNVQQHEQACRVTGVKSGFLLVASHIKPWRSCQSSDERLDGNNGLLLTPHVDRLFDRGYISFQDSGEMIISAKIEVENLTRLGISEQSFHPVPFDQGKYKYLDYHRGNVFLG